MARKSFTVTLDVDLDVDLDNSPGFGGGGISYNSDRVEVKPVVQVELQSPNNAALPSTLTATLTWNSGPSAASDTFSLSSRTPGEALILAVQAESAITSSGRYSWTMDVSDGTNNWQTTGHSFVVASDSSAWGAGWTFSDTFQLVDIAVATPLPAGKLLVYGSGGHSFFEGTSSFTSPSGDNGTLAVDGSGWKYTKPDGREWHFDSGGNQTKFVNADGHQTTTFSYTSGDLTKIEFADGAVATITLSSGLVDTVESAGRTWTMTHSSGDLPAECDRNVGKDK